ncbi:MAG: glycosyltransferase family 39 protein [Elusimicrobiota bacterium]
MKKTKSKSSKPEVTASNLYLPGWIMMLLWGGWIYWVLSRYQVYPQLSRALDYAFYLDPALVLGGAGFFSKLWGNLWCFFLLALLIFSAYFLGRLFFRVLKLKEDLFGEIIFSIALGLGMEAYLVFGLGLGKLLYPQLIFLIIFGLAGGGIFFFLKREKTKPLFWSSADFKDIRLPFSLKLVLLAIFSATALMNLLTALTPETFYDSLVYHLAVPQYYLACHQIKEIPFNFFSNYPAIMEMLYTVSLALKDEILAKLLVWLFGVGVSLTFYVYGTKFFNRTVGFYAAIFFYLTPLVSMVSWKTAVDLGTAFFGVLAVIAFFQGKEDKRWFVVSGCLAGLCAGTKYVGGFIAISLVLMFAWKFLAKTAAPAGWKEKIRPFLLFSLTMFVFFSPWLVRNYLWKGNPIHPYLPGVFGGEQINQEKLKGLVDDQAGMKLNNFQDWLISPWSLTMQGNSGDTAAGPLFLLFLPWVLFFSSRNLLRRQLGWVVLISFVVGFFVSRHLRFHLAGLGLLGLFLVSFLADNENKKIKYLAGVVIAWVGFLNFGLLSEIGKSYHDPLGYFLGNISKAEYLSASAMRDGYPYPPYSVVQWANDNLDKNSCILFVGECRGYYSQHKFIAATVYDKNPLVECLEESIEAKQLYQRISALGVTHLLFNYVEAKRLAGYKIFDWDDKQDLVLKEFWTKYLAPLHQANRIFLYRLISPQEAANPNLPEINTTYNLVEDVRNGMK